MNRFKTMGIAVAMALALTAFVGAAQASASTNFFKAGFEPETWSGSLSGSSHKLWLGEFSNFSCSKVAFTGETKVTTLTDVTAGPELSKCEHQTGAPENWTMNGCKFRFHPGSSLSLIGSMDIVGCVAPMLYENGPCHSEIGNQSGLGTVQYKNIVVGGVPAITVIAQLTGLTYTRNSGACAEGPPGTFSNGTYKGEWTVKGASIPGGAPAAVEVEAIPSIVAEEAPVTIAGTDTRTGYSRRFSLPGGHQLYCKNYTLSGSSASASTEALTLVPTYKNCLLVLPSGKEEVISDSNVSAGGCSYLFQANGNFSITGATCASNPITITAPGCVSTIGPQGSFSGFPFKNEGSGKTRTVSMSGLTGEKVTYTLTGASCQKQGTFSTGLVTSVAKLTATNSKGEQQGIAVD